MPEYEKDVMLKEMHTTVMQMNTHITQISTVLMGYEGSGGLVKKVEDLEKNDKEQNKFMYKAAGAFGLLMIIIPLIVKYFSY